jgi:aminopeptidase N
MKQNIVVAALFGILTMLQFSATAQTAGKDCRKGRNLFPRFFKADNARSDTLDVLHIHLDLDMTMMDDDQISAVASILVEAKIDGVAEVNFDLLNLTVDSVLAGPNQLSFNYVGELLKIDVPEVLNIGDQLTVDIHYQGSPQTDDSGWGGFYFQGDYAYNLGVGFEADPHTYGRAWFPCFDNFVERSTYTFDVLTSQGRSAYCNGLLNEVEELPGDSAIYHWSLSQSIPSYLASVAVSHFSPAISNFASISGADIPVYLTAQAEDTANAKASFIELDLCLETFEERFGPYLWDRVGYAFVPFSSGAMEHATNISYPLYAADGSTAFNTLMAHELAHHWWGDLITCRTQEDMWLNEGWASFCEFLFIEALEGEEAYLEMVKDNHKDVVLHAHEDDGERLPVSGIGHEHTYGTHVYNKGADMAYNLRAYMGDDDFFEGTTDFLEDHAFTDVSSHDLMTYLSDFGDADLEAFFLGTRSGRRVSDLSVYASTSALCP